MLCQLHQTIDNKYSFAETHAKTDRFNRVAMAALVGFQIMETPLCSPSSWVYAAHHNGSRYPLECRARVSCHSPGSACHRFAARADPGRGRQRYPGTRLRCAFHRRNKAPAVGVSELRERWTVPGGGRADEWRDSSRLAVGIDRCYLSAHVCDAVRPG